MYNKKSGEIIIPIVAVALIIGAFIFSRVLEKKETATAKKIYYGEKEERGALCKQKKTGQNISLEVTPQAGLKTQH